MELNIRAISFQFRIAALLSPSLVSGSDCQILEEEFNISLLQFAFQGDLIWYIGQIAHLNHDDHADHGDDDDDDL